MRKMLRMLIPSACAASPLVLPASTKAKTCAALAIFAFRLGLGDAFQLPRQHNASFKLGDRSDDLKHKFAGRIVRVEIHIQDAKGDAFSLQPINDFAQMPDRARQTVNFRDNQGIAFARKLDCRFKLLTRRNRVDLSQGQACRDSSAKGQLPSSRTLSRTSSKGGFQLLFLANLPDAIVGKLLEAMCPLIGTIRSPPSANHLIC
jgi:hypothetical protein